MSSGWTVEALRRKELTAWSRRQRSSSASPAGRSSTLTRSRISETMRGPAAAPGPEAGCATNQGERAAAGEGGVKGGLELLQLLLAADEGAAVERVGALTLPSPYRGRGFCRFLIPSSFQG